MNNLLDNKVAVVTGGISGIGRATVDRFLAEGARVVIADIRDDLGERVASELGDHAAYVHTDVRDEHSIEALVSRTVEIFGTLDIFFNNAGTTGSPAAVTDIDTAGLDSTLTLDVDSVVFGHKYAARQFIAQGSGGSIITTASVAGLQGGWSSVSYSTAKHAVVGTVRHAAMELSQHGIRTNAIAPGVIMTPLIANAFGVPAAQADDLVAFLDDRLGGHQALGRYGTAEDIANAAVFLASDLSSYISGTVLPVDGGVSSYTLSTSDADIAAAAAEFTQ
ncbi:SDR family NAD(P)-dependent oxidoreductase [Corynebacterium glyciniphilum]|uniref:SDR family NAD(P)-dependent oxidoreductase n=1 Tax=Corynebacterium glyciniphilum TaxID=1404244 RepID=UPI003DA15739